jgi:hypothetical protein
LGSTRRAISASVVSVPLSGFGLGAWILGQGEREQRI